MDERSFLVMVVFVLALALLYTFMWANSTSAAAEAAAEHSKKKSNDVVSWENGNQCESGRAGLWNDRGSEREVRCCPTATWINKWSKGWCGNLPINAQCIMNDQCTTKICQDNMLRLIRWPDIEPKFFWVRRPKD